MNTFARIYWSIACIITVVLVICTFLVPYPIKGSSDFTKVQNSFVDKKALVQYISNYEGGNYYDDSIEDLNELEKKSSIIVKIKPTGRRSLESQCIKTQVTVEKCYKGNIKKNKKIYVYEPSEFDQMCHTLNCYGGYMLMQDNKSYILFLKGLNYSTGMNISENDKNCYMTISSLYAKYMVNSNSEKQKYGMYNKKLSYSDIKDWLVIFTSQKQINQYEDLYDRIIEKYN